MVYQRALHCYYLHCSFQIPSRSFPGVPVFNVYSTIHSHNSHIARTNLPRAVSDLYICNLLHTYSNRSHWQRRRKILYRHLYALGRPVCHQENRKTSRCPCLGPILKAVCLLPARFLLHLDWPRGSLPHRHSTFQYFYWSWHARMKRPAGTQGAL